MKVQESNDNLTKKGLIGFIKNMFKKNQQIEQQQVDCQKKVIKYVLPDQSQFPQKRRISFSQFERFSEIQQLAQKSLNKANSLFEENQIQNIESQISVQNVDLQIKFKMVKPDSMNEFIQNCVDQYVLLIQPDPKIQMLTDIVSKVVINKQMQNNKLYCLFNAKQISYRILFQDYQNIPVSICCDFPIIIKINHLGIINIICLDKCCKKPIIFQKPISILFEEAIDIQNFLFQIKSIDDVKNKFLHVQYDLDKELNQLGLFQKKQQDQSFYQNTLKSSFRPSLNKRNLLDNPEVKKQFKRTISKFKQNLKSPFEVIENYQKENGLILQ